MTGFYPTNESADCWPAMHSYNFINQTKINAANKEYSDWLDRNQSPPPIL